MMLLLLLSIVTPLIVGFLVLSIFWRTHRPDHFYCFVKGCLAIGLGLGVSSCVFFIWLSVLAPLGIGLFLTEIAFVLILLTPFLFKMPRWQYPTHASTSHLTSKSKLSRILSLGFYVASSSGVATFIFLSLKSPHGGWDAWTIWNLIARFLFKGGDHWTDASLLMWSKPDYPLLIPATIARHWMYIGHDTVVIPVVVAMLFTFATVGLLFSALAILRGNSQGFLAGLVLLGTPFFVSHGASQYADVPLAFFFLATVVLVTLHLRSENPHSLLPLAGMTAGLAAWTKNEGALFLIVVAVSLFGVLVSRKGLRGGLQGILSFSIGLVPVLAVVLFFKLVFAPPNNMIASQSLYDTLGKLISPARYFQVLKGFIGGSLYFGEWSHVFNTPTLLAYYGLILGINIEKEQRSSIAFSILVLSLLAGGYFFTYVTTPYDLSWHLDRSANRILLQLWPGILFVYFMLARPLEKAISSTEDR